MSKKPNGTQSNFRKQYLTTPMTYPELKKPLVNMKKEYGKKDEIARFSVMLFTKQRTSIYKKLFNRISQQHQDMSFNAQDIRTIRNMYLKRLVESNVDNFPIELSYDEYKASGVSRDDKIISVLAKLKEAGKNEKIRKDPLELSRGASMNNPLNLERKESADEYMMLRNKQKRKENDILKGKEGDKEKDKVMTEKNKIDETDDDNEEDDEDDKDNNGKDGSFEDDDLINDENVENDDSQNMNDDEDNGGIDEGGEY